MLDLRDHSIQKSTTEATSRMAIVDLEQPRDHRVVVDQKDHGDVLSDMPRSDMINYPAPQPEPARAGRSKRRRLLTPR